VVLPQRYPVDDQPEPEQRMLVAGLGGRAWGSCPQISIKGVLERNTVLLSVLLFLPSPVSDQTRRRVMGKQERVMRIERQEGERHERDYERQWAETMEEFQGKGVRHPRGQGSTAHGKRRMSAVLF
jgi:hypothetical protein